MIHLSAGTQVVPYVIKYGDNVSLAAISAGLQYRHYHNKRYPAPFKSTGYFPRSQNLRHLDRNLVTILPKGVHKLATGSNLIKHTQLYSHKWYQVSIKYVSIFLVDPWPPRGSTTYSLDESIRLRTNTQSSLERFAVGQ